MSKTALSGELDYDLRWGVEVLSHCFTPETCGDWQEPQHSTFIPPEAYATPPQPIDPDVMAIRKTLLDSPFYMGGPKGQRIGFSVLGEDAPTDEATAFFFHWRGCRNEGAVLETASIMRRNPGMRLVIADPPGCGLSDPLPRPAIREVARSGRHTIVAEAVLAGIESPLRDFQVSMRGRSEGGLVALEAAALYPEPVKAVSVLDSPGSRSLGIGEESRIAAIHAVRLLRGMHEYFFTREGRHSVAYAKLPGLDPAAAAERAALLTNKEIARQAVELIRARQLLAQIVYLPLSMARGKLGEAVEAALPNVTDNLTYVSPVFSELNHPRDVRDMLARAVGQTGPGKTPKVVRQLLVNGTHAFGTSTPTAIAEVEEHAIRVPNPAHDSQPA